MKFQWSLAKQLIVFSVIVLVIAFLATKLRRYATYQRLESDLMKSDALLFIHEGERGNFVVALKTFETNGIEDIARVPNLKRLVLSSTQITDEQLKILCRNELSDMNLLSLSKTAITDKGLAEIDSFQGLKFLDISDTAITDASIAKLGSLKNLVTLNVQDTRITNQGKRKLRMLLPNLRFVESNQ